MGAIETDIGGLYETIMGLSAHEREQLLANVQHDAHKSTVTEALSPEEGIVYTALMEVCASKIPHSKLFETYGRKKFVEKANIILDYTRSTRKAMRRPQLQGLVTLCLKCLAKNLKARDIPVTPRTLLDNIEHLSYAVNRAFPGYASAGMLHILVDRQAA